MRHEVIVWGEGVKSLRDLLEGSLVFWGSQCVPDWAVKPRVRTYGRCPGCSHSEHACLRIAQGCPSEVAPDLPVSRFLVMLMNVSCPCPYLPHEHALFTCTHACIHACIHTCIHACKQTNMPHAHATCIMHMQHASCHRHTYMHMHMFLVHVALCMMALTPTTSYLLLARNL